MNIEKLRNLEPVFGSWFIDGKVAQGKNSNVYSVSRKIDDKVQFARKGMACWEECFLHLDYHVSLEKHWIQCNSTSCWSSYDSGRAV